MRRAALVLVAVIATSQLIVPGPTSAQDGAAPVADSLVAPDKAPVTGETPAATPPDKAPAAPAPTDKMPADTAPDAAPAAPAPTKISPGAKVYIQPNDFGMALTAAFLKKNVPVSVLTDSTKADFWVLTTSKAKEEKTAVKIVRFLGGAGSGDKFDATVTVLNRDGTVVFAYTSRKENSQSAAQNVAKNLKKQIEKK